MNEWESIEFVSGWFHQFEYFCCLSFVSFPFQILQSIFFFILGRFLVFRFLEKEERSQIYEQT